MSVEFVGQVFHDSWLSNSQPYLLVNLYIVCDTKNHGIFHTVGFVCELIVANFMEYYSSIIFLTNYLLSSRQSF
jgi:hypothetical protein